MCRLLTTQAGMKAIIFNVNWNSNYWYAKTAGKKYEDFADANAELIAIQNKLNSD